VGGGDFDVMRHSFKRTNADYCIRFDDDALVNYKKINIKTVSPPDATHCLS